jgi:hypothetical protein
MIMLAITSVLFAGVMYLAVTQRAGGPGLNADLVAENPLQQESATVSGAHPIGENEAPSLFLNALAASVPDADPGRPASAVIENLPAQNSHNPIAILEGKNDKGNNTETLNASPGDAQAASGRQISAATGQHGAPSSLLNALNAPAKSNSSQIKRQASQASAPLAANTTTNRPAPAAKARSAVETHLSDGKTNAMDTDVVLLEALVSTSNRQEAKDRATSKSRQEELSRSDKPKTGESENTLTATQTAPEKNKQ